MNCLKRTMLVLMMTIAMALISTCLSYPLANNFLTKWRHQNNIPGVVITVSYPNGEMLTTTSGYIKRNSHQKVNQQALFRIGSITKTFVSAEILKLEAQGKLSINDTIGRWFPQYPRWANVTIKQLLNMTAGMYRYIKDRNFIKDYSRKPYKTWSDDELIAIAYRHTDYNQPGKAWHYSNTNYLLLAKIIEKVKQQSLDKILNQDFIKPLGLKNTYYAAGVVSPTLLKQMAHGYKNEHDVTLYANTGTAAGGMISNTEDIAKWGRVLFTSLLPDQQLAEFKSVYPYKNPLEPKGSAYGLGIFSLQTNCSGTIWWYTGVVDGYSALMIWFPQEKISVAATINQMTDEYYQYLFPQQELFQAILQQICHEDKQEMRQHA